MAGVKHLFDTSLDLRQVAGIYGRIAGKSGRANMQEACAGSKRDHCAKKNRPVPKKTSRLTEQKHITASLGVTLLLRWP